VVEYDIANVDTGVRFPHLAPIFYMSVCARMVRAVSAKDIYAGSTPVTDSILLCSSEVDH